MEQKAPVTEPMPKDNSAMETPVTVPEAEAKAESASAMETPVTITEGKADSVSVTDTPVTVTVPEGKAESASATDMTVSQRLRQSQSIQNCYKLIALPMVLIHPNHSSHSLNPNPSQKESQQKKGICDDSMQKK